MNSPQPIGITGLGAVSALGLGIDALRTAIASGAEGIRKIDRFSTEGFGTRLGALVPLPGRLEVDDAKESRARCEHYATLAGQEALKPHHLLRPERVALVLGTSMGSHLGGLHACAADVAKKLGIRGPALTVSTACASSTHALGIGRELLDQGLADVVLAGGSDVLVPEIFAGFHALGLLSAQPCAPFSEATGTTLGEGAGFLVLERADTIASRNERALAWLTGHAFSADGYHATSPDPSGAGVARALRHTLIDAGLQPNDVTYVNAHGTGTAANDPAEWQALTNVFGSTNALAVSSTKGALGHAQGAAGILELIATLLSMERGTVPPTLHFTKPRRRGPTDPVAGTQPRAHAVDHALSTSSAFGGANAVVAVSRRSIDRPARASRPLFLLGGATLETEQGRFLPIDLRRWAPTVDERGMDPSAVAMTAVVARALKSAGVQPTGPQRERWGVMAGVLNASPASWDEFRASIRERGLPRCAAPAFTRLVLNSSTGVVTRQLGLKGPTNTVTCGRGSGLLALILGAMHLERRSDVDTIIATAVDEKDPEHPEVEEGAAAVVLSSAPGSVRLAGWGLAGPQDLELAVAKALGSIPRSQVTAIEPSRLALASDTLGACVGREHRSGFTLVTDVSEAASCAVLLEGVTP